MIRKRWMRQPMSWRRGGAATLAVLLVVAGGVLLLDEDPLAQYGPIVERLQARGRPPLELIGEVGEAAQIVVLSDARGRAGPKALAAAAVGRLADGGGLDAVVLEVPASEQPYIDAYLRTGDASVLLSRPAAVREAEGLSREYLRIYEAVRELNQDRPPSRWVRVIAADEDGWPPDGAGPRQVAEAFAGRARRMLTRIDRQLFSTIPQARVLVFVDGYMALQQTHGTLELGSGESVEIEWLGELLRRRSGSAARTVLIDPGPGIEAFRRYPGYHGTALHRPLHGVFAEAVGARVSGPLASAEDVVLEASAPGLRLRILPEGSPLGAVAQGYIFLPGGR